jgi:hypothetical protein
VDVGGQAVSIPPHESAIAGQWYVTNDHYYVTEDLGACDDPGEYLIGAAAVD